MARKGVIRVPGNYGYLPGQTVQIQLPTERMVSSYHLRFGGTITMVGGVGGGAVYADAAARSIRKLTLRYSDNDYYTLTGQALSIIQACFGQAPMPQAIPSGVVAGTVDACFFNFRIPLFMPWDKRPDDYAFPSFAVRTPTLFVQYAPLTDLYTAAITGVPTLTVPFADLWEEPLLGESPTGQQPNPRDFGMVLVGQTELLVGATGNDQPIYLDHLAPGVELRAILAEGLTGLTFDQLAYADTTATAYKLTVNGVVERDKVAIAKIQADNAADYGLAAALTGVAIFDAAVDRDTRYGKLWTIKAGYRARLDVDAVAALAADRVRVTTVAVYGGVKRINAVLAEQKQGATAAPAA